MRFSAQTLGVKVDSIGKIESAKKLLASGVPAKDVAKNLGVRSYAVQVDSGPLRRLNVL